MVELLSQLMCLMKSVIRQINHYKHGGTDAGYRVAT